VLPLDAILASIFAHDLDRVWIHERTEAIMELDVVALVKTTAHLGLLPDHARGVLEQLGILDLERAQRGLEEFVVS